MEVHVSQDNNGPVVRREKQKARTEVPVFLPQLNDQHGPKANTHQTDESRWTAPASTGLGTLSQTVDQDGPYTSPT